MDDANFAPSFRRGGVKKVKGAKSILRPFFVANGRCQFCAHFPGKWAQNTFCARAQGAGRRALFTQGQKYGGVPKRTNIKYGPEAVSFETVSFLSLIQNEDVTRIHITVQHFKKICKRTSQLKTKPNGRLRRSTGIPIHLVHPHPC